MTQQNRNRKETNTLTTFIDGLVAYDLSQIGFTYFANVGSQPQVIIRSPQFTTCHDILQVENIMVIYL